MSCRISVIMGIYNCAPTLQEALDSLYAQTYQGFKVILCDDRSTDDTMKIAEENARLHDNVIVIRNDHNMKLAATLNHCLEYADTEYVARMDGDDVCDPTRFEKEASFLDEHPEYAIVSTPMIYFDENGEFARGHGGYEPHKEDLNYGSPFCHAPCMIRRAAYESVDGYSEDVKVLRNEDYHLWMKMFAKGYRGYMLSECLYSMRDDRNAAVRRSFKSSFNSIYAHYLAYKELNLSFLLLVKYVFRMLIAYSLPKSIYIWIHKKKLQR